ncbi:hypothetical protein K458DRAFT_119000 [Lentithecium fluviatile CBS 122367]|uniref:Uncharacterized protein n=1 Tax=Lentithecium fluviatile CBS 122367 TaxID=1168545 RepID=A0A6G1ILV4_9PLEO|nr:hypothetical protein K458DRAFT_119000 [Lentithecium fluviatile CBS 122367]
MASPVAFLPFPSSSSIPGLTSPWVLYPPIQSPDSPFTTPPPILLPLGPLHGLGITFWLRCIHTFFNVPRCTHVFKASFTVRATLVLLLLAAVQHFRYPRPSAAARFPPRSRRLGTVPLIPPKVPY